MKAWLNIAILKFKLAESRWSQPRLKTTHPGPQKIKRRAWISTYALRSIVLLTSILAIHSIVQSNIYNLNLGFITNKYFLFITSLILVDPKTGLTLFLTSVAVAVVREQYLTSIRPNINYSNTQSSSPAVYLNQVVEQPVFWNTQFENNGGGSAKIVSLSYSIELKSGRLIEDEDKFDIISKFLSLNDIEHGKDCWIVFYTKAATLVSGRTYPLFSAPLEIALKFKRIDVKIEFESHLGDRYYKEIWCIPRIGISNYTRTHRIIFPRALY